MGHAAAHIVSDEETGAYVASVHPASDESVFTVLAADPNADKGMARSQWPWVRLADGTLVLGVFPQDGTYFAVEVDAETPLDLLNSFSETA